MSNNIPQGYKQTELGIIPEDWEYSPSQKYLKEISMGPFGSDIKVENFVGFGIPVLNGANLQSYRLIDRFENYVTSQKAAALKKAVANKGDIIITHRGTLGQVTYIPKSAKFDRYVISQSQFRVRFNECIDSEFIVRYLLSPIGQECLLEFKGHTGVPALAQPTTNFRNLPLLIPPIAEQRAIAEALSDVDGLIAALDKKIAKKRLLKQGAMQQLLTGKTRLPGFTDEWVEIQVKELGKWSKGQPFSKDQISADGKNSCIHYGELFSYGEVIENVKSNTDVKPSVKSSGKDVLFPASDVTPIGLGRCSALNVKNVLLGGDIIILEVAKDNPAYISYVINLNKQQIIDRVTGTTVKHINSTLLGEIKISISTNIQEQQAIATILSDMDKEISDLEAQRDKYRLLKSGMMQKLLTGQIRLKNE